MISSNRNKNDNQSEEMNLMMPMNRFITLAKNDELGRVDVHLRGIFESPQSCTQELTELHHLSSQYPTACVYINSDGGRIDLLMELTNILKKFQSVITVVTSNAASAGFMLWCIGDVRVVCPHAEIMAHRETSGMIDKTHPMSDRVEFLKRRFDHLFVDLCGDFLTEEEIELAKRGELWFLGEDFIEREQAISWEKFCSVDSAPPEPIALVNIDDVVYMDVSGLLMPVKDIEMDDGELYNPHQIIYGVHNPKNLLEGLVEPDENEEEDSRNLSQDVIGTEERFRSILRDAFGKGQYQISKDVTVMGGEYWSVYVFVESTKYHFFDGHREEFLSSDVRALEEDVATFIDELDD